ncbi:hypothetical protein CEUSTIGMA_g9215.t1 [Chlamydomonas eustigma]|uniref:Uncharacterized protein n=1 Tax=Chlamydomonas eustigma TaxID=1157962 RepID=A0A250XFD9_9CHLO|nr:hypothetical protein CEUSTIGMA_g9215.t1 [Chlamydomonas eustigma]|eukprot:GAX81787.1 hypothetical protein CEUSTIGMA_g9215.t1 [Chlamydomonas eustigma]
MMGVMMMGPRKPLHASPRGSQQPGKGRRTQLVVDRHIPLQKGPGTQHMAEELDGRQQAVDNKQELIAQDMTLHIHEVVLSRQAEVMELGTVVVGNLAVQQKVGMNLLLVTVLLVGSPAVQEVGMNLLLLVGSPAVLEVDMNLLLLVGSPAELEVGMNLLLVAVLLVGSPAVQEVGMNLLLLVGSPAVLEVDMNLLLLVGSPAELEVGMNLLLVTEPLEVGMNLLLLLVAEPLEVELTAGS